jgi:hypothetical protein
VTRSQLFCLQNCFCFIAQICLYIFPAETDLLSATVVAQSFVPELEAL